MVFGWQEDHIAGYRIWGIKSVIVANTHSSVRA